MPRPAFPKNLREFQRQFATEEACQDYLVACRWPGSPALAVGTLAAAGTTVYTDGLGGFAGLPAAGFAHIALKQPERKALRKGAGSVVPLADRAIGNLQQWLIGTYHGVSRAQLPV